MPRTYRWAQRNDGDKEFYFRTTCPRSIGTFVRGERVPDDIGEDVLRKLWRGDKIVLRSIGDNPHPRRAPRTEISIEEAIRWLDPEDEAHWTSGGKPRVQHLEFIVGRDVTSKERDAAWKAHESAQEAL